MSEVEGSVSHVKELNLALYVHLHNNFFEMSKTYTTLSYKGIRKKQRQRSLPLIFKCNPA